MSDYTQFINESSATLDRILGKSSQGPQGSGPQGPQGPQGSGSQGEGSNINDLTNLFHFLLLDKVDVKQEIRDKLTKVYTIFRSNPISQPGAPQPGPLEPGAPQPGPLEPGPLEPGAPKPEVPKPSPKLALKLVSKPGAPKPLGPQPPSEITYTPLEQKPEEVQLIDTEYSKLLIELKNKKYLNQRQKHDDPNDIIKGLIDKIRHFTLYEKCLKDGKVKTFETPLDYIIVNRTANAGYTSVERDYFIGWATKLKEWVDGLK
jgi:hypothetical protein